MPNRTGLLFYAYRKHYIAENCKFVLKQVCYGGSVCK